MDKNNPQASSSGDCFSLSHRYHSPRTYDCLNYLGVVAMTNNNQLCASILGLMRISLFGEVAGEDIVSELEECRELWTVVVPGTDIGTEHQTQNVVLGRMVFDELRILTTRSHYLDVYEKAIHWQPNFIGVSFVEGERVELVLMWES
jgi:hypothetical protein